MCISPPVSNSLLSFFLTVSPSDILAAGVGFLVRKKEKSSLDRESHLFPVISGKKQTAVKLKHKGAVYKSQLANWFQW